MTFGNVIRVEDSPGPYPLSVGGNEDVIWNCDWGTDKIYELSTTDFSVIREASSPNPDPYGVGGTENTLWHCG